MRALFAALEARRHAQGLSWNALAAAMWEQSRLLSERRPAADFVYVAGWWTLAALPVPD